MLYTMFSAILAVLFAIKQCCVLTKGYCCYEA